MPAYSAPIDDMKFVMNELLEAESLTALPGFEDATPDLVEAVLGEAAKLCEEVLAPVNRSGDEEGCTYENGVVRLPTGHKEAYQAFAQGGWGSLVADPEFGGQGLPALVGAMVKEMACSTNVSLAMLPGLTEGACHAFERWGTDEQKATYLPKMLAGTWAGTMCLTEPQCGTDLGLVRTKAEPAGDGSDGKYRITGTKIFISHGEQDATENIIHLVLARLPDAPAGIQGISLFVVPKFLVKEDGSVGPRNGVMCGSIEHKMGIKASPTCVMNFDEAEGELVGLPHKGMRAMFTMMNDARLAVGIQGLGLAEAAYQGAVSYAKERLQMRSLAGAAAPDKPADPIIVHPDVRRMLMTMRAYCEGGRALAAWTAMNLDIAAKHPDEATRQEADDLVSLLTPVVKAFLTDVGSECANLGVQVYGGHGYIREHGMEQLIRDARIAQIYEGTNGIQALDLVGRKLGQHTGRLLRRFFHPGMAFIEAEMEKPEMQDFVLPFAKAFSRLQQATAWIAQQGLRDPEEAGAAASDYLRLFGLTALAYMWARMAAVALAKQEGDEMDFYKAKLATARFYMTRILPQTSALFATIMAGKGAMMELEEAMF
jgi:butyryl-CoA dehydrogenase